MSRRAGFVLTPESQDDLFQIQTYLSERTVDASTRVGARLEDAMRRLGRMPGLGHFRADLTHHPYRFWRVYSYFIVYDPVPRPIRIVRVIHGARDATRELQ